MTFCYFIVIICDLVIVNYCDFHIAVTDVPVCLWNTGAPLAGNTGFICPLSTSASTKQSGWLHNLWATNSVVNRTGYLGPLYASRHQTSLWRRQHIYSVHLLQTPSISIVRLYVCKHCVANAPDYTAQPAATSSPHSTVTKDVAMEYRRVVGEWRREHDVIFIRSNPAFDRFQMSNANWLMINRALFCIAISAIRKRCCIAFAWICGAKCDAIPLIHNTEGVALHLFS